jgi:cytoskeletal protein CcmA (bactofilin family)
MKVSISRGIASILGRDLKIEGKITSNGEVLVLGSLKGTLTARTLTVERGGIFDGDVEAETVAINGEFSGSVTAESVRLGRTASVTADITYVSMEMNPGSIHCGQSRHVDHVEAKAAHGEAPAPVLKPIRSVPGSA